ncbi:hypothetical protein, partial [Aeromonas hydrophila]|uniref:hypothetical protein n=1 Tax=Aeromonas hydrophila TaxID=644 RepID=UPI001EE45191
RPQAELGHHGLDLMALSLDYCRVLFRSGDKLTVTATIVDAVGNVSLPGSDKIGRASWRARVLDVVYITEVSRCEWKG